MLTDVEVNNNPATEFYPTTPQPHFIPGYTGFCPELPLVIGASYGCATSQILKQRPEIASRLRLTNSRIVHPDKENKPRITQTDFDKKLINCRLPDIGRKVLDDYMIPGYSGHVPNKFDAVGVSFTKGCVGSISKFIRRQYRENEAKSM